jgi:dUTP pyrophosphatase
MDNRICLKNESGWRLERATDGSIGYDLRACIESERYIQPAQRWKFDTGISIALPPGMGALVQPRSGMGLHHGIVCVTGVIDRDFRGRIAAVLINHGTEAYKVNPGDRIAQLVPILIPIPEDLTLVLTDNLEGTARGDSGFGSTGR